MKEENDSKIISEMDVILCRNPENTEIYRVQYPIRKVNPYSRGNIKARYKMNVKMLEMRWPVDRFSASFNKGKAENLTLISNAAGTSSTEQNRPIDEEVYVGRSFLADAPVHYAAGFFRDQRLYVCPVKGTFSMNRSISYMNNQGKAQATKTSEEEMTDSAEEDEEEDGSRNPSPIRVRYKRPETERQKKRREQSSAHRSRLIEQDPWTPLIMNCETDAETSSYCKSLFLVPIKEAEPTTVPDPEQLVQEAIIGVKMAALDLNECNQLISLRRIRHLPEVQQVRALMIKARCISTEEAVRYVSKSIPRHLLISRLRDCANLVGSIWVLKSELLYPDEKALPYRCVRDLVLCLFNSGLPVKRVDLQRAFGMSTADLDEILKTFNRVTVNEQQRTWSLNHEGVAKFGKNKDELKVLIEEKRHWHKRWDEIHNYLMGEKGKMESGGRTQRNNIRRNSGSSAVGTSKRHCPSKTVVID